MKLRSSVALASIFAVATTTWLGSCSSGLGHNKRAPSTPTTGTNANRPVGFDIGFTPSAPIESPAIAGVVVPAIGATPQRDVALLAFATAAAASENDGAGTSLSRDSVTDANSASDIFVAALPAQSIDTTAFSQSLAGKFRHPRCATCHSMQRSDSLAFVSSPLPHAGPQPGPSFPNNAPAICAPCHVDSNTFPVVGWQAPAASFDIRSKTVAEIAVMAQNVPTGDTEHFVSDKRVLWALDSGILPAVNGRNGIADDNQNGVFEPEDIDGIPRPVPGGSAHFLAEITAWRNGGLVVTNKDAVADITLVSRNTGGSAAGNGASTSPRVVWVPNPSFDPTSSSSAFATNPIGTLYVAFESTSSNLVAGDGNGVQDVFRATVQLRAEEDTLGNNVAGSLNVAYVSGGTVLCSAVNGGSTPGNGASAHPVIGGSNGEWVAFDSAATNLIAGFTDGNGAGNDVYLRQIGVDSTELVSHTVGNAAIGGDGSSERPALAADGTAIAFESDATDLVASDGNGQRDVFSARADTGSPFTKTRASVSDTGAEGIGGDSSGASVWRSGAGRVLVAYESTMTNLAPTLTAAANVFVFDSDSGHSTLLNQRIAPTGDAVGDGDAHSPVIAADGALIAFSSAAGNIDVLRETDINHAADIFFVETAQLDNGNVLPYRTSITATESADANGASTAPMLATLTGSTNYGVGLVVYPTAATNLGTSDATNLMLSFVGETSGVIADFSATPLSGPAPLQVQFTDLSSGTPTVWAWDFDGDALADSTEQNPLVTFSTPGNYTVSLTASNANSTGTKTIAAPIRVFGPVTADFTPSTTSGNLPLTVVFTDASTEPFGTISAWSWDFGDGATASTQNPSHDYTTQGDYTVVLSVTGEGGNASVTRTGLIHVDPAGPITANFTSVNSAYNNVAVAFTDTSTGVVTDWAWDFGDGGTSTAQNPTHTFATAGTYTVSLVASGFGVNDTETKVNWITSVPANETTTLTATADNTIYEGNTGNSNGAGVMMIAGRPTGTSVVGEAAHPRRAMVKFDISSIPAGSTINSARVDLVCDQPVGVVTGAQTISFRRITTDWSEGTAAGAGTGAATAGGGATWLSPWSSNGGDFAGVSSSTSVNLAGTYSWTGLATDVHDWLTSTHPNFGWMIVGNEAAGGTVKRFMTREATVPTPAPPQLVVNFTRPLP